MSHTICLPQAQAMQAAQLELIALDIEHLQRATILQVAALVSQAHDLFVYCRDEGGFAGWATNRLGYSSSTAYRLLDIHKKFGPASGNVSHVWETLKASALYLLAAPSVSQEVLDAICERIAAGEELSTAAVRDVIGQAKGRERDDADDAQEGDDDPSIARHRAAMAKLAAESEPDKADEPDETDEPDEASVHLTDEEVAAAIRSLPREKTMAVFDPIGVADFLAMISPEFIKELAEHLPKLGKRPKLELAANHLQHMRNGFQPEAGKPDSQ